MLFTVFTLPCTNVRPKKQMFVSCNMSKKVCFFAKGDFVGKIEGKIQFATEKWLKIDLCKKK